MEEQKNSGMFRDYVTSASFFLSLSKRQIEMLCHIDHCGHSWGYASTAHALAAKGLIAWSTGKAPTTDAGVVEESRKVILTDAGRAVIPLLRLAGLYVEQVVWPEPPYLPDVEVTIKRRMAESTTPQGD